MDQYGPDHSTPVGATPLMLAAVAGNAPLVHHVLAMPVDLDALGYDGMTRNGDLIAALDWAYAQNFLSPSGYEGKIRINSMAVMGQSCGGLQATVAAADPRVKTAVIWNSGTFSPGANPSAQSMSAATKGSLAKFHAPVAYFPGGPSDLAYGNSKDDFSRVTNVPAFFGSIHVGHGGEIAGDQPVEEPALAARAGAGSRRSPAR
mgnify:CR=1 FL=1